MQDFTKILLVAIFYSPFYPLIYFLSATILFIQYWVDKFLLLVSFYHVSSPMHLLVPYQPLQHPQNHRGAGRKHLSLAQKRRGSVEFISPLLLSSWEQYLQLSPMLNLHLLSCVVVTKIVIVSATSPIHNHSPTLSFWMGRKLAQSKRAVSRTTSATNVILVSRRLLTSKETTFGWRRVKNDLADCMGGFVWFCWCCMASVSLASNSFVGYYHWREVFTKWVQHHSIMPSISLLSIPHLPRDTSPYFLWSQLEQISTKTSVQGLE
jgi:hypothetical protein